MGQLIDGNWVGGTHQQIGAAGWEPRKEGFRDVVSADAGAAFPVQAGRYLLVECPGCPLSQRVSMVHRIKGLQGVVPTVTVLPEMAENGREFLRTAPAEPEPLTGFRYLYQAYAASDPTYTGRASTPVLFDLKTGKILSNNTRDIFAMFNHAFDGLSDNRQNFLPDPLQDAITDLIDSIYTTITSAVYKCGFARSQAVYDDGLAVLESGLDQMELRLTGDEWLLGAQPTEADFMLYTSLARYDAIYLPLFRTVTRRIEEMPALTAFLRRVHQIPGVAETYDLHRCMEHYFLSHRHINPSGVVPAAPHLSWL